MIREIIKQLIYQFHQQDIPALYDRELELPLFSDKIVFLSGIRRCGKTSLLFKTMEKLEDFGVDRRQMIYINLEDNRLFPIERLNMEIILEYHADMYPRLYGQPKFIFIDEIRYLKNWQEQIRKLYEQPNVFLFVTASSSKPDFGELKMALNGCCRFLTLFPLSFKEYMVFQGINLNYEPETDENLHRLFNDYLYFGGFPEVVLADSADRQGLLQEYVDLIIYKDLLNRHDINNAFILKYLLKYCFDNVGNVISVNHIFMELKEQGVCLSKNTLYGYLNYLENSYLIFLMGRHDESVTEQPNSQKKVFVIDNGLMLPMVAAMKDLEQRRLQNAVFLNFRRNKKQISYLKKEAKVDFIVKDSNFTELVRLENEETGNSRRKTNFSLLRDTARHFDKPRLRLLTNEKKSAESPEKLRVQPYWEFFIFE